MSKICKWWYAYTFDNKIRTFFHKPEKIFGSYIQDGMTIMDVGCGMGYFSIALAKILKDKGSIISVDAQQKTLDVLEKRAVRAGVADRISCHLCKANRIGIAEKADFVLAFWMVHEVPNQEEFLAEIYSILKQDGKFLVAEPKLHVSKSRFEKAVQLAIKVGFEVLDRPKIAFSQAVLLRKNSTETHKRPL